MVFDNDDENTYEFIGFGGLNIFLPTVYIQHPTFPNQIQQIQNAEKRKTSLCLYAFLAP